MLSLIWIFTDVSLWPVYGSGDFILLLVKFVQSSWLMLVTSEVPHSWNKWHLNVLIVLCLLFSSRQGGSPGAYDRSFRWKYHQFRFLCHVSCSDRSRSWSSATFLSFSISKLMYDLLFLLSLRSPTRCPVTWRSPYPDRLSSRTHFNRWV